MAAGRDPTTSIRRADRFGAQTVAALQTVHAINVSLHCGKEPAAPVHRLFIE
jgi:hypothetical protein